MVLFLETFDLLPSPEFPSLLPFMSALFGAPPVGLVKGWDDDDPSEPAYPSVGCIDAIARDGGSKRNGVETLFLARRVVVDQE